MLTIEKIIKPILSEKHWQSFNLHMSVDGFEQCSIDMKILSKNPQVYLHVCNDGKFKNRVLRIGKAETGSYQRWLKASDGHKSTFLWSIGQESKYGLDRAIKTPLYMLFFAGLKDMSTKLYVLNCEDKITARSSENTLINYFHPLWEDFKNAHNYNSAYPILSGKQKCEKNSNIIAKNGSAIDILFNQRNGIELESKYPDILDFDITNIKCFEENLLFGD